ncbi:hypothetical protein Nepgr_002829 [Nepenthes gracilis]|uniref:Uncharacterized protein n=1 Tax=Nepenthes gracilis TaxID=150966 RepID=A0AAD3P4C3_NEPGR|nr:hypothetical protein Nepgr_002829 [Nepenthes gracilis]
MRSEVPDELVPGLDQPELGSTTDGVCIEATVCRVDLAPNVNVVRFDSEVLSADAPSSASHCWQMAPCGEFSHLVVNCSSKLAPVDAEEVPVVAGPKMAPCPIGNDKVEEENAPLLDDRPLADAESIESLATVSSPNPHAAPADQAGKAPGTTQLALVF